MKKVIGLIGIIAILLTMSVSVFAGDVPEALSYEDDAQVFIGTLKSFETDSAQAVKNVTVVPTRKIKGDISPGETQTYTSCYFGSVTPEAEKEYLFGCLGENSVWVYAVEYYDEKEIKLKITDEFAERIQNYLDEGLYIAAEQERLALGKQISFAEYLYKNPSFSSSGVEKVTLRYQDELHEVDTEEFLNLAESIMITNVKDSPIHEADKADAYKTVLYVELLDANDQLIYYGAVSRFGEVDRYGLAMSRLMAKDCEMKTEDLSKLYALFPKDVQKNIAAPEGLPSSADETLMLPDAPQKNYTGWMIGGVLIIFVIAFAIGYGIRKRK